MSPLLLGGVEMWLFGIGGRLWLSEVDSISETVG
jgi:hypothetical protein